MSEEKKEYLGKAYGSAPQALKQQLAATADGDAVLPDEQSAPQQGADGDPNRGRSQGVLPGILGKQLRAAYGELLSTPVPDRISELIKELQRKEASQTTAPEGKDEENGQ